MSSVNTHNRIAVSIEYQVYQGAWPPPANAANPRVWFGSHDDIIYPDGVVPLQCYLHETDGVSRLESAAKFFEGQHTSSKMTIKVVDKNGILSNEIASRLVDNTGTRRAIIRVFLLRFNEKIIDVGQFNRLDDSFGSQVIGTYFFMDHDFDNGLITIECEDISTLMFTELFQEENFVQTGSVSTDAEYAVVWQGEDGDIDTPFNTFEHNEAYTYDPGVPSQPANCGYKRFANTGEIFSHEPEDIAFQGALKFKERGVFGTNPDPAGNPADSTNDQSSGPAIENIVYIEEQGTTMAYAILTGRTSQSVGAARILPESYSFNIDPGFVNEFSFYGDTSNNGSADNLRLRVLRKDAVKDGRRWVEKQIFAPLRSVMYINRFGQIELLRRQTIKEGNEVLELNETNCIGWSPLKHVKTQIKNPVRMQYDKSILDNEYKRILEPDDVSSTVINQDSEALTLQFETLYHGVATRGQLKNVLNDYQEYYNHEHLTRTINVLPSVYFRGVRPGQVYRVRLPKQRDDAQIEPFNTLETSRLMTVESVTFDPMTCECVLQLKGTLGRTSLLERTQNLSEIPDDKFLEDTTPLSNLFTMDVDNSTVPPTYSYSGSAGLAGGTYGVPGNFIYNGSVEFNGHVELRVMGEFFWNGLFDGTGRGIHKPGVAQTTFGGTPPARAATGDRNKTMIAEAGFFGTPNAVGGTALLREGGLTGSWRSVLLDNVDQPSGEVDQMPEFHLSNECGCLRGLPPSMNGTPSSGTPISYNRVREFGGPHSFVPGLDGAPGGGSFSVLSRGGTFGPNGKLRTNGGDAPTPIFIDNVQLANSGGMPGGFGWWTDGGAHEPPFTEDTIEDHFDAYAGNSGAIWDEVLRPEDTSFSLIIGGQDARQWWPPTDERINRAKAASIHQYVPRNEKLYESQNTHWLDSEADLNPDNLVRLWSSKDNAAYATLDANGIPPVPAPGSRDLWVSEIDLNSNLPQEQIVMWRYQAGVWSEITSRDSTAALLLDVCRLGDDPRIKFGIQRPECPGALWFDDENTDKAVRLGATEADDRLVWLRSYGENGEDLVEDGRFLIHEKCEPTWMTDTNLYRAPNIYPGGFPKYDVSVAGSTAFGSALGEESTPGWQLDAVGNGSVRVLRPIRPIRIHPGNTYIAETVIRTTGIAINPFANQVGPAWHGFSVFMLVFDENGNALDSNKTDNKNNSSITEFLQKDTTGLTRSGYIRIHHEFTLDDTTPKFTGGRYLVPNLFVHGLSGSVVVSEFHFRRQRFFTRRGAHLAGLYNGAGTTTFPSVFVGNELDLTLYQGARFVFSTVADCTPSANCSFTAVVTLRREGADIAEYRWTKRLEGGIRESLSVEITNIAQEYFDAFKWRFFFHDGNETVVPGLTVDIHENLIWSMNSGEVVESGTIT